MKYCLALCFALMCMSPSHAQLVRLSTDDLSANGHFGKAHTIYDQMIVVSESNYNAGATSHLGRAHVFESDQDTWNYAGFIATSHDKSFIHFAGDVSVFQRHMAISAPDLRSGAVSMYEHDGTSWQLLQEISLPVDHHRNSLHMRFGESVEVHEDWLVITAPGYTHGDDEIVRTGAVFIYQFDGTSWVFRQKILPPEQDKSTLFGEDIEISESWMTISAPKADGASVESGVVYLFKLNGTEWQQDYTFIDPNARSFEHFGMDVDIAGNTVVIGVPMYTHDESVGPIGAAHIFQHFDGNWVRTAFLHPSDGKRNDMFGSSVVTRDGYVCIGSPRFDYQGLADVGKVYVYQLEHGFWSETLTFIPPSGDLQPHVQFGASLSLHENHLVIGGHLMNNALEDSGIAYVTELEDIVSTPDLSIESGMIRIHPNPGTSRLQMSLAKDHVEELYLMVYSMDGIPVYRRTSSSLSGSAEMTVDTSLWPSGTYFIHVTCGKQVFIHKWIKV